VKAQRWLSGLLILGMGGCSSMNNTESGALGGGVIGAGVGALVGAATGHAAAGALIGGGAGAAVGAVAGNSQDKAEARQKQAATDWAAAHPPVAINDIVQMAQQHISDDIIIGQIRSSYSAYALTPADITFMKQQGVSDRVIAFMQSCVAPPAMIVPGRTVYVVEPAPVIGVGVYGGYGYRRHW
jgi:hypothetical protein